MTRAEFYKRYQYNNRTDKIGGGSFGTVYKAYDRRKDIEVAVKVQEVQHIQGKEFSLQIEYDAIKSLEDHPNIANYESVHRFEEGPGVFDYAIMQYYALGNLSNYLKNHDLSYEQKSKLLVQILQGIAFLHHHGVVHRDIKPGNILVVNRPNEGIIPKITDFGLSKLAEIETSDNSFKNSFKGGTVQYSAPEQLRGLPLKLNADLWSFGVIIYEVFTGQSLFEDTQHNTASVEWQSKVMSQILNKDIDNALEQIPEDWREIARCCLIRDNQKRPATGKVLLEQLKPAYFKIEEDHFLTESQNEAATLVIDDNEQALAESDMDATVLLDDDLNADPAELTNQKTETAKAKPKGRGKVIIASILAVVVLSALGLYKYYGSDTITANTYLAKVKLNDLFGYIDIEGNEKIPPQYVNSFGFTDGLAPIKKGEQWGYIDYNNQIVLNGFQLAAPFSEGLAAVKKEDVWIYIDKTGARAIDSTYELIGGFKEGLSSFRSNGKWGYMDRSGHWVIKNTFAMARPFSNGLAGVKQNGLWGFIDKNGNIIIPTQYKNIRDFSEAMIAVQGDDDQWMLINKNQERLIEASFDDIKMPSEQLITVKNNKKWGVIDMKGNQIIDFKYDGLGYFVSGLAAAKVNGKWGFINAKGETVIDFKYDYADNFKETEK